MHNQNRKFETLLQHAATALGLSDAQLKDRYKDYPICLMEYIEKGIHEHVMEVRFDEEEAVISVSFDSNNNCDASYLFFDSPEDEEHLIRHLIDFADYDFRKSSFLLTSCSLKIKERKTRICFYLFR